MPTVVQDVSGDSALQTAIAALKAKIEAAEESGDITQLVSEINTALAGKQNTLTFDQTPTAESTNPVTSVGIKNAIEAAVDVTATGIYETASGSIASFADGADNLPLKSCVVNIEPIQEGEGDPSPENVRPISGRTGLNVVKRGKNLINPALSPNSNRRVSSVTYKNGDNEVTLTTVANANYMCLGLFYYFKSGTYTIKYSATSNDEYVPSLTIYKSNIVVKTGIAPDSSSTFTISADGIYEFRLFASTSENGVVGRVVRFYDMQFESGSVSTPWTPYKSNTYSVNWETEAGTVYGARFDVLTGKLTVDRVISVFDGSQDESWSWTTATNRASISLPLALAPDARSPISNCNMGTYLASGHAVGGVFITNNKLLWYYPPTTVNSLESYRTWLSENNLQVAYELAESVEYQLSANEVRTLLGENNIWSDSGDISVEYPADTKLYIDQKIIEAIAAAMA